MSTQATETAITFDDKDIPVATILGDQMSVTFQTPGGCTITLPGDPGTPRDGIITLTPDGRLHLSCDTGMAYIGPAIDTATHEKLINAVEITVNERRPGQRTIHHSYNVTRSDVFASTRRYCKT